MLRPSSSSEPRDPSLKVVKKYKLLQSNEVVKVLTNDAYLTEPKQLPIDTPGNSLIELTIAEDPQ